LLSIPTFLVYDSRAPPALHSFPTRRSSDLWPAAEQPASEAWWLSAAGGPASSFAAPPVDETWPSTAASPLVPPLAPPPVPLVPRSEEHTSELQSRSDLVCRLLLEKKKKHT